MFAFLNKMVTKIKCIHDFKETNVYPKIIIN